MSILGKCALLAAAVLLLTSQFVPAEVHAYVSSAPLAMAGLAYAILQIQLKPRREILLKRLLLAGTFLLWAVVQLLPAGHLAVFLGDTVIAAYVLDLFWVMQDQVRNPVEGDHESGGKPIGDSRLKAISNRP